MMRAAAIPGMGKAPEVVEVPTPTPGPGEALVRMSVAALQPVDMIIANGRFYDGDPEFPLIPGLDGIGTVVSGHDLDPGTRVRVEIVHPGYGRDGTCAEYVVVPEVATGDRSRNQASAHIVDAYDLPDDTLAALGSPGGTAWKLMEAAEAAGAPIDGTRVLILGATGAVGEILVQLCKHRGAKTVVAAGRNLDRLKVMLGYGADATVALTGQDVADLVHEFEAAGGGQFDLIFDPLWGDPAAAAFNLIAVGGVMVNFGGSAGPISPLASMPLRARRATLFGYSGARTTCKDRSDAADAVYAEAAAGRLKMDYQAFSLQDIGKAWDRLASSGGKILVETDVRAG